MLRSADKNVESAWRLALKTVEGNIRPWKRGLMKEERPALMAGGGYDSPWTRDASYNTYFGAGWIYPDVTRATLLSVLMPCEGGARIGGQYWDAISWVTGAWAQYSFTGDEEFLRIAWDATRRSLEYFERTELDAATGLFCGPGWSDGIAGYPAPYDRTGGSSFILDYARHNANVDKIRMKALSTNSLYTNAYRIAARMAQRVGKPAAVSAAFEKRAARLRDAINRELWMEKPGRYAYFVDVNGKIDPSMEALGHAHAILFGVADAQRAQRVFSGQYVSEHGVPCVWPLFPRFREPAVGRHCGTVWPQIQGFWALAGASRGRLDVLRKEFEPLTSMALKSGDFREIYHPRTGEPYGGIQCDKLWRSEPRQTWAATAWIAMMVRGVLGMTFEPDGVTLRPLVPKGLAPLELTGARYRAMTLDIRVRGGGARVLEASIDGKKVSGPTVTVPATLRGRHVVEMVVGGTER